MRISRIEIRLRLQPGDWAVELWQWPHQEFVKQHKVKTALVAVQMGPVEIGFWIGRPGQYEIVPEEAEHGDEQGVATRPSSTHPRCLGAIYEQGNAARPRRMSSQPGLSNPLSALG